MIERVLAVGLVISTAGLWSASTADTALLTQDRLAWHRTESRHFTIHYLPALAGELERVERSAERAYDRVSGRLDFVLPTRIPLVLFAPSGPITRHQVTTYATSDLVAPQRPHRSRIVLPLQEGETTQIDALLTHELTHLLVAEILLPQAPGDGGVPRWVHEGIANYMTGRWSEDHERLTRTSCSEGRGE